MNWMSKRGATRSQAQVIANAVAEQEAHGHRVIKMSLGQPSTGAPKAALSACNTVMQDDILGYTCINGTKVFREQVVQHYQDHYGVAVDPSRIMATFGASGGWLLCLLGLFDVGDKIAIPTPCYAAYIETAQAFGLEVVTVPTTSETAFHVTVEHLQDLPTDVKGLLLINPGNPTGTILPDQEVKALVEWCRVRGIKFLSDEIYHGVEYGSSRVQTALHFSDDVVVLNSFSKYFTMPGWRVGWLVLPEGTQAAFNNLARNMYVSPSAPAQLIAAHAMQCKEELNTLVARYKVNHDILVEALPKLGFHHAAPAQGGFYYYAAIPTEEDSLDFCLRMIKEAHVAATPGKEFDPVNGHRYVRFSYAGSTDDVQEAVRRLQCWLTT